MNPGNENAKQDPPSNIVVIEDHEALWAVIRRACRDENWTFQFFASAEEALEKAAVGIAALDLVIVDLRLPGVDGVEALRTLQQMDQALPVIMLTAQGDSATVVRCMKLGAYDYITKPFRNEDMAQRFRRALEKRRLLRRCASFESSEYLRAMMGPSQAVQNLAETVQKVSPTEMAVLIEGESGTGKEILARYIHRSSRRSQGPFVAVDAGAIPETLLEGELFGFKKGSFTGAIANREGKFQLAHGGTLFLDEIENLPLHMQAKILRSLQQKEVVPVGATAPVSFSARLIAATNSNLQEKVAKGEFRLDLFHRIAEFPLVTTPLRERIDDLLYLCTRFLREACAEFGKRNEGFSEHALEEILSYPWPGNVRELKSVIRRAALVSSGRIEALFRPRESRLGTSVTTARLDGSLVVCAEAVIGQDAFRERRIPLKQIRKQLVGKINKAILDTVLARSGGNKSDAARILDLDYKTVYALCRKTATPKESAHEQTENPQPGECRL